MIKLFEDTINQIDKLQEKLVSLSDKFAEFSILDSKKWEHDKYHNYDLVGAFGASARLKTNHTDSSFELLDQFFKKHQDWAFGFLSYDLKNELEELTSNNNDFIEAPYLYFFIPKLLVLVRKQKMEIRVHKNHLHDEELLAYIQYIRQDGSEDVNQKKGIKIDIKQKFTKEEYINAVDAIRKHIKHGDIYELNFCQEFYAENVQLNPQHIFQKLTAKSPAPFSCFLRQADVFVISSSPERYLKKTGSRIISQPIKGTSRRSNNAQTDNILKNNLRNDPKERAENIMIVDLVRNDLSHTAMQGSVKVEELCEIYSFEQVHQMISTISSEIKPEYNFVDVLKSSFPMGSMTGAPKIKAMELIEQYEKTKRGIYSGAIGYITPDGDFDFNVVIRTIIYNTAKKYLSFIAGGAITYQSEAEKEYEESLLKAEAIREILA